MVPRQRRETRSPVLPRVLYCILCLLSGKQVYDHFEDASGRGISRSQRPIRLRNSARIQSATALTTPQPSCLVLNLKPLGIAAVGAQNLAVDPRAVGTRKEGHDTRNILGPAQPFERW